MVSIIQPIGMNPEGFCLYDLSFVITNEEL
jgi:hypothetical protein